MATPVCGCAIRPVPPTVLNMFSTKNWKCWNTHIPKVLSLAPYNDVTGCILTTSLVYKQLEKLKQPWAQKFPTYIFSKQQLWFHFYNVQVSFLFSEPSTMQYIFDMGCHKVETHRERAGLLPGLPQVLVVPEMEGPSYLSGHSCCSELSGYISLVFTAVAAAQLLQLSS